MNGAAMCSLCGQRPGAVRMIVATPQGRGTAVLCAVCAQQMSEGGDAQRAATAAGAATPGAGSSATPALDSFGTDLTDEAREGRIDPVIGRADEIEQAVEILARRRKNNAVLI